MFLRRIVIMVLIALAVNFAYKNGDGFLNQTPLGAGSEASASAADPAGCQLVKKPVAVELDRSEYPATVAHVKEAVRAGEPKVIHLDRGAAESNRDASLEGIPTKPGHDRDEWPMAASEEGGSGAHIKHVPSSDNRGAGASVGSQLRDFCSGQAFFIQPVP